MKHKTKKTWSLLLCLALTLLMLAEPALAADDPMNLDGTGNVVWHNKGTGTGMAEEVTRIGLVQRDTYRYGQSHVFDILLGYENSAVHGTEGVQTSYKDGGYGSAAVVGTDITKGTPLDASGSTQIGDGVSVAMDFTGLDGYAIIRVDYTVFNNGGSAQTVTVGGTVDTCIAWDDYANVRPFDSSLINGMKGLVSTARSGEFLGFAMEEQDGEYWYGRWQPEQSAKTFPQYIAKAGTEDSLTEGKYDSSMSWKWQVSVPAGGSVTKSCYLGVGNTTLGDDPADMETIGKYRVTLNPNAGGDTVTGVPNYLAVDPGNSVATLPTPARDGYTFGGWYTAQANGTAQNTPYTPTGDMTLYAQWSPIKSTVNVALTLDSTAWSGQSVALYSGVTPRYTLTENGTAGTYSSNQVVNGTYIVYVNGENTGVPVTVAATTAPVTEASTAAFSSITVTTNLDSEASSAPGTVTLRQSGLIKYTLTYGNGAWSRGILTSSLSGSYDVFVNGADTGADVSATSKTATVDFYTMTVNLTNDTEWNDARVTLRETDAVVSAILPYTSTNGTTAVYTRIMQEDNTTIYKVFVNNTDTHKTVQRTADKRTAQVTFYTATLNVTCSALPDTFSVRMSNGADSYVLTRGTKGSVTPFTAHHVLQNDANPTYTAVISGAGTAGTGPISFDSTHKTQSITVYKLTYKNDGADYGTDYVLSGGKATAPANPTLAGYTFDGWGTGTWNKTETSYTAFSFSAAVTADQTIYAHYLTPTVRINGYLRTGANGTANTGGTSFRMPNFTIYGFTGNTIKYIRFEVANVSAMTAVGLTGATFNATTGLLTFTTPVSAATAQQTVRDCIVVTPVSGENCTVTATVIAPTS